MSATTHASPLGFQYDRGFPSKLTAHPDRDLWALAASRLNEKDRACVDLNTSGNINDILESVEKRRQECVDKQWTVPRGRNRDAVVLRDVFTKIAVWINKFMAVGDIAVQYDPGHAALPWALIRFLLKVRLEYPF